MTTPTMTENNFTGIMRYFTAEWLAKCQQRDPSFNPQKASDDYSKYIAEISSQLPDSVHELESSCSLHDCRIRSFEVNPRDGICTVQLDQVRFGEKEDEKSLSFTYGNLGMVRSTANLDQILVGASGFGDLAYYEFHVLSPDVFQHAYLFASGIEFGVEFQSFEFSLIE